jgi:uncharacterized protein YndB with AHSA1/START domain
MERCTWKAEIAAGAERVWEVLFGAESYPLWTAPFAAGSRYEGSFTEGTMIRFVADEHPDCALESLVETVRRPEFLSIRHDFGQPAYENYTLRETADGVELTIEQDLADEWGEQMRKVWPKALAEVKRLAEGGSGDVGEQKGLGAA